MDFSDTKLWKSARGKDSAPLRQIHVFTHSLLPAYPSLCLCLSVLSNCLSVRLSVCLSVHLSACPGCLHVGFLSSELTIFSCASKCCHCTGRASVNACCWTGGTCCPWRTIQLSCRWKKKLTLSLVFLSKYVMHITWSKCNRLKIDHNVSLTWDWMTLARFWMSARLFVVSWMVVCSF